MRRVGSLTVLAALTWAAAGGAAAPRAVDPPAAPGASSLALAAAGDGALAVWIEAAGEGLHVVRFARFDGERWSEPTRVAQSERMFVNWADTPGVAAAADGTLVAWWLERSGGEPHAYSVVLARSADGGASWKPLGLLHDDTSATEHGFVSMVAEGDALRAYWLDGRGMAAGGPMQLRTARVAAAAEPSVVVDERVCDCCATSAASIDGEMAVAYRDRSEGEIRDIALARATGGKGRSRPVAADRWRIAGCPVNGPALVASGKGPAVAWFTGAGERARVSVAFAPAGRDGEFGAGVEVDGDRPLGRVGLAPLAGGDVAVLWLARSGEGGAVKVRRARADGTLGPALELGVTTASRAAGVPRVTALPDGALLVTWLDARASPPRLRAVRLDAAAL